MESALHWLAVRHRGGKVYSFGIVRAARYPLDDGEKIMQPKAETFRL